ncbi:MAG: hypothetical protein SOY97_05965 [Candidatus Metalachnospira sp.]|nr:hypothetical protein [Candidatus Metalachnospira sp.]
MSIINIDCIDQTLVITNSPSLSSGDIENSKVAFNFDSAWERFTKTAIFYQNEDNVYYSMLDDNDVCVIPWEAMQNKGTMYFGVYGQLDGTRITSEVIPYTVLKGAITENLKPSGPTPDIYEQIMQGYAKMHFHVQQSVTNEEGAHDFRYFSGGFWYKENNEWQPVDIGVGSDFDFKNKTTVISEDNKKITETFPDGTKVSNITNKDETGRRIITEIFTYPDGSTITKTTTINGKIITEVVS